MPTAVAGVDAAWGAGKPSAPSWAQITDPPSDPEVLGTIEWQNVVRLPKARLALTLYHQELADYISWIGPWTNVGDFKGNGAELSAQASLTPQVDGWLSASLNDSKLKPFAAFDTTNGNMENQHLVVNADDRILASPMYVVNAGLTCRLSPTVTLSPTLRYFTKEPGFDLATSKFITIENRYYADVNLLVKNPFRSKDMDLSLGVTNLFNNRSQVAGQWIKDTYAPQGIVFTASLDWKF